MKSYTGGNNTPSSSDVAKLLAEVARIQQSMSSFLVRLTKDERQRTLKLRPGGVDVIQAVGEVAKSRGVSLTVSVDDMNKDLELAQSLKPVIQALARIQRALLDTDLQARSEAWYAATAYYTALARLASQDPDIEDALKPIVAFFATGARPTEESNDEEVSDAE